MDQQQLTGLGFRFLNAWTKHHQFKEVIKSAWEAPAQVRPVVGFANKLKATKKTLWRWNKEIFGRIDQGINQVEDHILEREIIEQSTFEANKILLCQVRQELNAKLANEELFWRQKANIK